MVGREGRDDGFTLIEVVVATAVLATLVVAGIAVALGARSFAVSAAASDLDRLLAGARATGPALGGAFVVFSSDAYGDGTEARVMVRDASGNLVPTAIPAFHARAGVVEAEALGALPFALVVHTDGALRGRPGFRLGDALDRPETDCPVTNRFRLVVSTGGVSAERSLPCRDVVAATTPAPQVTWPPIASPSPVPACTAGCAPVVLPTPPASAPTCPPGYVAIAGGCALPTPPPFAAPSYHVTATAGAATVQAGGTTTLAASATLTNAAAAPPGSAPTLPVRVTVATPAVCSVAPSGSQPSGTTFTISTLASGTCTLTVGADTSPVPGATADTASVTVTVTAAPPRTPSCDLIEGGTCFHSVFGPKQVVIDKNYLPQADCSDTDCVAANVGTLTETTPFQVELSTSGGSSETLLTQVSNVTTIAIACEDYSQFAGIPYASLYWPELSVGTSSTLAGTGEPNKFVSADIRPHTLQPFNPSNYKGWSGTGNVGDFYHAVALGAVSTPLLANANLARGVAIADVFIDIPGCTTLQGSNGNEFGTVRAFLTLEVYQA